MRLAAEADANVLAVASNEERLSRAVFELRRSYRRTRIDSMICDLGQPRAAEKLFHAVESSWVPVDVLINDAGFGDGRDFIETPFEILSEMIDTNVRNLTILTRLLIPGMVERGYGRVLNLASTGSFVPGPHLAVYCATKAYVLSLSQAIWHELAGSGVTVTALCPGATDTDFARAAGMLDTALFRRFVMKPEAVARIGLSAMLKGRRQVTAGTLNRLLTFMVRFSPVRLVLGVTESALRHRSEPKAGDAL